MNIHMTDEEVLGELNRLNLSTEVRDALMDIVCELRDSAHEMLKSPQYRWDEIGLLYPEKVTVANGAILAVTQKGYAWSWEARRPKIDSSGMAPSEEEAKKAALKAAGVTYVG